MSKCLKACEASSKESLKAHCGKGFDLLVRLPHYGCVTPESSSILCLFPSESVPFRWRTTRSSIELPIWHFSIARDSLQPQVPQWYVRGRFNQCVQFSRALRKGWACWRMSHYNFSCRSSCGFHTKKKDLVVSRKINPIILVELLKSTKMFHKQERLGKYP